MKQLIRPGMRGRQNAVIHSTSPITDVEHINFMLDKLIEPHVVYIVGKFDGILPLLKKHTDNIHITDKYIGDMISVSDMFILFLGDMNNRIQAMLDQNPRKKVLIINI